MKKAALTNEMVDASQESYLVDFQGHGEMLAICFGFYDANGAPQFDFFKRLKKLEVISGKKINKLLLRDKKNSWYHYGVEGLGNDADAAAVGIQQVINEIRPGKIITIGQSMGGYAALMYAALLNADKAVSFGPLSCFAANKLEILRDYRWLEIVKKVEAAPPKIFYNDLPRLLAEIKSETQFEIFYGTSPGANGDRNEAVNYDAAHALAFHDHQNVRLFPFHNSPHAIVEYLRVNKIIDDVLMERMLGLPPKAKESADLGLTPEWVKWLEENIRLGCSDQQLVDALQQNNLAPEIAITNINRIRALGDLARISNSFMPSL